MTPPFDVDVSIIIVSWNVRRYVEQCLNALYAIPDSPTREIFVVDNASTDGTADCVAASYPHVRLIRNSENVGFARANNQAIPLCRGRYLFLLNPDTEVLPHAVERLKKFLDEHPKVGVVAPQLLNSDRTIQPSCRTFPTILSHLWNCTFLDALFPKSRIFGRYRMTGWNHTETRSVDQPMGAALVVRSEAVADAGMMDPAYFLLFDEVDWCLRIKKKGWEIFYLPDAQVIHHGGKSFGQRPNASNGKVFTESRNIYYSKHYGAWSVPIVTALDIVKIVLIASPIAGVLGAGAWLAMRTR